MQDMELEYYRKYGPCLVEEPPASTFMQPASLAKLDMLVEIDVIAVILRWKNATGDIFEIIPSLHSLLEVESREKGGYNPIDKNYNAS